MYSRHLELVFEQNGCQVGFRGIKKKKELEEAKCHVIILYWEGASGQEA